MNGTATPDTEPRIDKSRLIYLFESLKDDDPEDGLKGEINELHVLACSISEIVCLRMQADPSGMLALSRSYMDLFTTSLYKAVDRLDKKLDQVIAYKVAQLDGEHD